MLVMIKTILYERTVALCASMDLGKGLGRPEPRRDNRWSRWRKETMKTGIRI